MKTKLTLLALLLSAACTGALANPKTTLVDFSGDTHGWIGSQNFPFGGTTIDSGITPTDALHANVEIPTLTFATRDAAFTGNYGTSKTITISFDVYTKEINFFGTDVTRPFVLQLRDFDTPPPGSPFSSVWYKLGDLDASKPFQHFSVTIANTKSKGLPAGWSGTGAVDENGQAELPSDRTFKNILASVDQLVFTSAMPGMGFEEAQFNVAIDNISISAVPEPGQGAMLAGGLALLAWAARRRQRQA